jgi:glutathione S-transferase
MALFCANISYELREVSLKNKPSQMLEVSPKGTVPVLVLPEGKVIDESKEIMLWSLKQNDPLGLLRLSESELELGENLIQLNDGEFKIALDRYKYPLRFMSEQPKDWRVEGEKFLKTIESLLEENKYLLGNKLTITDLAIMPFIRQFARTDIDWFNSSQYKNLREWLFELEASEIFQKIMYKTTPWSEGSERIIVQQ